MARKKETFKLQLDIVFNNEQRKAIDNIQKNKISILYGSAGVGKTLVAIYTGLKMLEDGEIKKLIVSRPAVTSESFGFLPGDLNDKYGPYMLPIIEFLDKTELSPKNYYEMMDEGTIVALPIAFMRGCTFENSYAIIDEAQNVNEEQMFMILTRLGRNSKIVLCGDLTQSDIKKSYGLKRAMKLASGSCSHFMSLTELAKVEREPCIEEIIKSWNQ